MQTFRVPAVSLPSDLPASTSLLPSGEGRRRGCKPVASAPCSLDVASLLPRPAGSSRRSGSGSGRRAAVRRRSAGCRHRGEDDGRSTRDRVRVRAAAVQFAVQAASVAGLLRSKGRRPAAERAALRGIRAYCAEAAAEAGRGRPASSASAPATHDTLDLSGTVLTEAAVAPLRSVFRAADAAGAPVRRVVLRGCALRTSLSFLDEAVASHGLRDAVFADVDADADASVVDAAPPSPPSSPPPPPAPQPAAGESRECSLVTAEQEALYFAYLSRLEEHTGAAAATEDVAAAAAAAAAASRRCVRTPPRDAAGVQREERRGRRSVQRAETRRAAALKAAAAEGEEEAASAQRSGCATREDAGVQRAGRLFGVPQEEAGRAAVEAEERRAFSTMAAVLRAAAAAALELPRLQGHGEVGLRP